MRNALTGAQWADLRTHSGCCVADFRLLLRAELGGRVAANIGLRLLRPPAKVLADDEVFTSSTEVSLLLSRRVTLITGSLDMSAALWDAGTGECSAVLWGHDGAVLAAACSRDGRLLATGSADRSVRLWSGDSGAWRIALRGHRDAVLCIAFSADSAWLISASRDRSARVWSTGNFGGCHAVLRHGAAVTAAALSMSGDEAATSCEDGSVRMWRTSGGAATAELRAPAGAGVANWAALSPDGLRVAAALADGTARVWTREAPAGLFDEQPQTLSCHGREILCSVFAPVARSGAKRLATASADGTCGVWELGGEGTWRLVGRLRGHQGKVLAVDFSPDGTWLATGGQDGDVRVWDAQRLLCARTLRGHIGGVASVAFGSAVDEDDAGPPQA